VGPRPIYYTATDAGTKLTFSPTPHFFFVCAAVIPREQTANLKTVQTNIFLPYFSQS